MLFVTIIIGPNLIPAICVNLFSNLFCLDLSVALYVCVCLDLVVGLLNTLTIYLELPLYCLNSLNDMKHVQDIHVWHEYFSYIKTFVQYIEEN